MIRGYHQYKTIWEDPSCHDELSFARKIGSPHNTHTVVIMKCIGGALTTVGHVPKSISSLCSIFLRQGGTIKCEVNGLRCYSSDLPQGGLEVSCILSFIAIGEKEWVKTKQIFESVLGIQPNENTQCIVHSQTPDISSSMIAQGMGSECLIDKLKTSIIMISPLQIKTENL